MGVALSGSRLISAVPACIRRCLASLRPFSKDEVLSQTSKERCIRTLQKIKPLRVDETALLKKAAVLVPLCVVNGEMSLLFTLRSSALRNYGGQVSFPGGMQEPGDESLTATALREAREELGLEQVEVWGAGSLVGTARRDAAVLPLVGFVGEVDLARLRPCAREVDAAFAVSLERLADPCYFRYTLFRNGYALPVFLGGEYRIWGVTAIITHLFLGALLPDVYKNQLPKMRKIH